MSMQHQVRTQPVYVPFLTRFGGFCWVINGHMQTLCIACLHDRRLFVVCVCMCVLYVPCCESVVSCALQMLSLHCMSGKVCFNSSKATAEDAGLTTHILARLLHSIAAVIVRSLCMLCTAQLASPGSFLGSKACISSPDHYQEQARFTKSLIT